MQFEPNLPQIDDLLSLVLNDTAMLDVRAPVEFDEGAFPYSVNRPLIDNEERHQIGKTYKDHGQDAAVELGLKLVADHKKAERIADWQAFAKHHPDGVLYCFRGGMRSKIAQQWLFETTGIRYPRINGGYKALRRFLIDQLEHLSKQIRPVVIGGRTGVGKTRLLQCLTPHLDLEHLAWHRGSAFGRHATEQPPQISFENKLSTEVLKLFHHNNRHFVLEDESRNIGHRHLPMPFYEALDDAPVVVLEASLEERIDVTLQEYVIDALQEYQQLREVHSGFAAWADYLTNSLDRIRKRLGGVNHQRIRSLMTDAISQQQRTGDITQHRAWIAALLSDYYDAMYSYQLDKKKERIIFTGDKQSIGEFLKHHYDIQLLGQ